MKTPGATQILFIALLIVKVAMPFTSQASQRVNAVIFKNQIIPAVELKEVVIVGQKPAILCNTVRHEGKLIPSVQMKEVNISASSTSIKGEEGIVAVKIPGIRTRAIAWRGEMIPQVDGPEVVVTANRIQRTAMNQQVEAEANEEVFFHASVRQTFDRIGGFILDQGKELLDRYIQTRF